MTLLSPEPDNQVLQTPPSPDSDCLHIALSAPDGHRIPVYIWLTDESMPARGIIHICHGMAEHAQRYRLLAHFLTRQGYVVIAHDHRGHGPRTPEDRLGIYAEEKGWDKVIGDVSVVQQWIATNYPQQPRYLLGHSMGSFIAQGYQTETPSPAPLAGLILSGSNRDARIKLTALRTIVALICRFKGADTHSRVIHALTFGAFSKSVRSARTDFDWLSTSERAVQEYMKDPYCGFQCTNGLWSDLGNGLARLLRRGNLRRVPADLPILILSGAEDPVGEFGRGVKRLAGAYRNTGHTDVSCVIFQGMRHEPFQELHQNEAQQTLMSWLARHKSTPHNEAGPPGQEQSV